MSERTPAKATTDPSRPLPNLRLPLNPARVEVVKWARQMLKEGCLILDTETIDLPANQGGKGAEICELALVQASESGMVPVWHQYLKPSRDDWSEKAVEIHGITPEKVKNAETIVDVWVHLLREISAVDHLVIYNRSFDLRALRDSLGVHGIRLACPESRSRTGCLVFPTGTAIHCAMVQYSAFVQQVNLRKKVQTPGSWKWQRLPDYGHSAHSALGDCLSTGSLLKDLGSIEIPTDANAPQPKTEVPD